MKVREPRKNWFAMYQSVLKNQNEVIVLKVFPCTVTRITKKKVKVMCLGLIPAEIDVSQLETKDKKVTIKPGEIGKYMKKSDQIFARVLSLNYNSNKVYMSMKDLRKFDQYLSFNKIFEGYNLNKETTFKIEPKFDYPDFKNTHIKK